MFGKILRFGALLAAPLALAGTAQADRYDDYRGNDRDRAALILFSDYDFGGEVREVFDPIATLPDIRFNDRARSVAVLEGQWEVCEHSDFTGRCVFIRHDVEDLRYFGLNRSISSVRPIYEYTDAEHGLMFNRDRRGYIRYADYDNYDDRYVTNRHYSRVDVYHYGTSGDYRRYGYYNPHLGYGPYGYNYGRNYSSNYGNRHYRRAHRPLRGHYGARNGAVTVYTDANQRGASLGLNRAVSDLSRLRFNDNVSSISIRTGTWEVCEHANFRGRCEIIDASTGRLNHLRLNDNISSIRPAGSTGTTGRRDRRDRDDRRGRRSNDYDGNLYPPNRRVGNNVQERIGPALMGGPETAPRGTRNGANRAVINREPTDRRVRRNREMLRNDRVQNATPTPAPTPRRAERRGNGRNAIQAPRREQRAAAASPPPRPAQTQAPRSQPRSEPRPNPRSVAGIKNRQKLE